MHDKWLIEFKLKNEVKVDTFRKHKRQENSQETCAAIIVKESLKKKKITK